MYFLGSQASKGTSSTTSAWCTFWGLRPQKVRIYISYLEAVWTTSKSNGYAVETDGPMVSLESFGVILQLVSWIPRLHLNSSKEWVNRRNVFISSFVMFNWSRASRALLRIMEFSSFDSNKIISTGRAPYFFSFKSKNQVVLLNITCHAATRQNQWPNALWSGSGFWI